MIQKKEIPFCGNEKCKKYGKKEISSENMQNELYFWVLVATVVVVVVISLD